MIDRNYIYKTEFVEAVFYCNKNNTNICPFGSLYYDYKLPCSYLVADKYCDNKFIQYLMQSDVSEMLTNYIMHDKFDMIDTHERDRNELRDRKK